jgi:hypothetical protein
MCWVHLESCELLQLLLSRCRFYVHRTIDILFPSISHISWPNYITSSSSSSFSLFLMPFSGVWISFYLWIF